MKDKNNNMKALNKMEDQSYISKLEKIIKDSIFKVVYVLLKNQSFNIWVEMILILLQLNQLLSYSFLTRVI